MTFDYQILPEKKLIVQRITGVVTIPGVIEGTERMWADPLYDKRYAGLTDLRGVRTDAEAKDIFLLTKFLWNPQTSVGKWAAILSEPRSTALALLVARATLKMALGLEIFSTWPAACDYLGVEAMPLNGEKARV